MKKLTSKSLLTSFVFLLTILVFSFFLIYQPLYKTLEETLLDNFSHIAETNKITFENLVEGKLENASSISSRTMIKNKILEYNNDMIDLEELKNYTQPKYLDGIKALEDLSYGARIVNKNIISSYGNQIIKINKDKIVDELSYEIVHEDEKTYLLIYSPIIESIIIGMDIIVFDLSKDLAEMELENISIKIIGEDEILKYQDDLNISSMVNEYKFMDDIVYLNVLYQISDNMYLNISSPKDSFYYKVNKVTRVSAINLLGVFILSFIGINFIIIGFAKKKINLLDESNKKHKEDSYNDTLTGAYTRLYLNKWLKENKLNHSIAFIDVDNFKDINDKYGHQKGDQVLKEIVLIVKNEIRENDIIVRYGGDEFIILLDCLCEDIATMIIERIRKKIKESSLLGLEVSFSYGISELKNTSDFYDVLKEIDFKMYQMKEIKESE